MCSSDLDGLANGIVYISEDRKRDGKAKFISGETDFSSHAVLSNVRHFHAVNQALSDLTNFHDNLSAELPFDLLVIDLQHAWEVLGTINGDTVEEDLLDVIFSKFCLGK